jgi:hypothetical protein
MPSPLGHLLGGAVAGSVGSRRPNWTTVGACAIAATLPDLDILLPIQHRGPTHSVAAAAIVFGAAWMMLRGKRWRADRVRLAAALALGVLSHTLLDWLGADSSRPRGVMALWPVSTAYYISNLDIFAAVDRRYWLPGFWQRNLAAVARELAILVPLTWFAIGRVKPKKRI